jgi:hypothetical protein
MQIKTTLRLYLTPVKIATVNNTNDKKFWIELEKTILSEVTQAQNGKKQNILSDL